MQALFLVPALPLLGALILALIGGLLPRRAAGVIGVSAVGLAFAATIIVVIGYFGAPPPGGVFRQVIYEWISFPSLHVPIAFYLDPLALVMAVVVSFVGLVVHLYAAEFMDRDRDYARFFAYFNLFVASMLILVLADNFLFFYLGWEGVGLCSYLLIGFWYSDPGNGRAAQKAFIVTRIGDSALAVALFLLFWRAGTFDIQTTMHTFAPGAAGRQAAAAAAGVLIVAGAASKSAQLPFQTWLPDAMAGPTPVSALIHAATMVTAGVYLIARTQVLFQAAPAVMLLVAIIGGVTCVYAATCALAQHDIKRVIAYSTMSQIAYMFLALGVGFWWAAIFHLATHAFFKSLLFLSAGIVIQAMNEEHDIHRMGGLFRKLPVAGWTFLIGALSLAALPFITAGFYSKDAVLWGAWSSVHGSPIFWAAGIIAAILTGIYILRAFFLVFLGPPAEPGPRRPRVLIKSAVITLAVLAMVAGFIGMPPPVGGFAPLRTFLQGTFGHTPAVAGPTRSLILSFSALASVTGIVLAYVIFVPLRQREEELGRAPAPRVAQAFLLAGWGFDWIYDRVVVRPYVVAASLLRSDPIGWMYAGFAAVAAAFGTGLTFFQSGRVRNYATGLLLGAVIVIFVLLLGR